MWHLFFFSKEKGIAKTEKIAEQSVATSQELATLSEKESLFTPRVEEQSAQKEQVIALPEKRTEKIVLGEGKTLRLLAEDLFGDREFWIYIYLENKNKIPNPNKVSSGTELVLPDKQVYSINASDPQSVAKAKSLGEKVLRGI